VKVSVFANPTQADGRSSVFHKVTVQKIYREGDQFKTTTSLGRDDVPVARLLLHRAWEFILAAEAGEVKETAEGGPPRRQAGEPGGEEVSGPGRYPPAESTDK
jgi:hypothetical protein